MASLSSLLSVIATASNDIYTRLYLGLLQPRDEILREKGGIWGLKVYEEIERDAHAFSVLQKRKLAPLSYPWEMEPASSKLKDKKAAQLVKKQLAAMNVDKLCFGLGDANLKGYGVAEVVWAMDGAEVVAKEFRIIDQRRIRFMDNTAKAGGWEARLLTWQQPLIGIEIPERKFIVHTFGSLDANPYGIGLGQKLYWPAWFKRNLAQFWLAHNEKFASPTLAAGYPTGFSDDDQEKLLQRLIDVKSLGATIFPEGMDIKALTTGTTGDPHERAVRYWDEEISKAVLGETLTTTMGSVGSYAASKTHTDVRLELAQVDANDQCGTLNATLVKWICELNCPGAGVPKMVRKVEQPADQKAEAEKDALLFAMGYRPDADRVEEVYGPGYVDEKEEALTAQLSVAGVKLPPAPGAPAVPGQPVQPGQPVAPPAPGAKPAVHSFAAPQDVPDPSVAITDQAMSRINLGGMLDPIREIVKNAKSLMDLRNKLDHAYPDLDAVAFTEVLAQAFTVATLLGRHEVAVSSGLTPTVRPAPARRKS